MEKQRVTQKHYHDLRLTIVEQGEVPQLQTESTGTQNHEQRFTYTKDTYKVTALISTTKDAQ